MNREKVFFVVALILSFLAAIHTGLIITDRFSALEQRVQKIEESIRK